MFTKILLPVDGSEQSTRAADVVCDLAKQADAEVLVYHVLQREVSQAGAFDMETPEEATDLVDGVVRTLKDAGVDARGEVDRGIHGNTPRVILAQAKAFSADVVVMGSRGLSDVSGMLLGSVTNKVIHLAEVPVLVVK